MNVTRRRLCAIFALASFPAIVHAASNTLTLGLFPHLPAPKLLNMYQPVADYLSQKMNREIRLFSARDFRTFYQNTHDYQFDLVITPPNLAWLAMVESGYHPLATFTNPVSGVLIVNHNAAIVDAGGCMGKSIAMIDPLSIVSQLGLIYLRLQYKMVANTDYRLMTYNNHTNAALDVMLGKVDCAVIGQGPFQQLAKEIRSKLRVLAHTAAVPAQFVMANPRLSSALVDQIRSALMAFNATSAINIFMRSHHLGSLIAATPTALEPIKPYALATQAILHATP